MPIPEGYETPEQLAFELEVPVSRVMRIARELGFPTVSFPDDNRRRRFNPEHVKQIRDKIKSDS